MQSILIICSGVFYKITTNTELANIEVLHLEEYRARFPQASAHNIFISQSIRNFVLCVLLFKDIIFNLYF